MKKPYHEQRFGEEIFNEFFLSATRKDWADIQLSIIDEKCEKIAERIEQDIRDEMEAIDLPQDTKLRKRALIAAFMAEKLPLKVLYNLGVVKHPEDIAERIKHLEGYKQVHRFCKKADIDITLALQKAPSGILFTLAVDAHSPYAKNCPKTGPSPYPDLYEDKPDDEAVFKKTDSRDYKL